MKNLNKIVVAGLILAMPFVAGCSDSRDTNMSKTKINRYEKFARSYNSYEWTIKPGDSLARYLDSEGFPVNLDFYVEMVKSLNKENKEAFVNYEGGQIRAGKKIILPDMNYNGKVGRK